MKQIMLVLITLLVLGGVVFMVRQGRRAQQIPTGLTPTATTGQTENSDKQGTSQEQTTTNTQETAPTVSEITLDIQLPVNNSTVSTSSVLVKGRTVANVEVYVNENELKADSSGNFSTTINLEEGENYVLISANDEAGNFVEREIVVNLETIQ